MSNTIEQRIQQWEKMCQEAPDDMAWFSLGNAYKEAERHDDAIGAFRKAVEFNPRMSRAFQNLGQLLADQGDKEAAVTALTQGYSVAAERGDRLPMQTMGDLLTKLGAELPTVITHQKEKTEDEYDGEDAILDRRSGIKQQRLPKPPFRGPLGQLIYDNYGQLTWEEWKAMGTKVINELRLDLSTTQGAEAYDQQMIAWLGISEEELKEINNT